MKKRFNNEIYIIFPCGYIFLLRNVLGVNDVVVRKKHVWHKRKENLIKSSDVEGIWLGAQDITNDLL